MMKKWTTTLKKKQKRKKKNEIMNEMPGFSRMRQFLVPQGYALRVLHSLIFHAVLPLFRLLEGHRPQHYPSHFPLLLQGHILTHRCRPGH